jgi:hypothetical protein
MWTDTYFNAPEEGNLKNRSLHLLFLCGAFWDLL